VAKIDPLDEELAHRRVANGEHRWPAALAVAVAAVAYGLLPQTLLLGPRLVIPILELLLLAALIAANPWRMVRRTRWSRWISVVLAAVVILANLASLGLLVASIGSETASPMGMLIGGMQVWLTNVIGFALLAWEIDRGGPVERHTLRRDKIPPADWRFSQDEDHDASPEVARGASVNSGWVPNFVDYLYMSLTNSSAFSPTDTMPLSSRAKMLMGLQATAALLTALLVIAKAVGSLGGGA